MAPRFGRLNAQSKDHKYRSLPKAKALLEGEKEFVSCLESRSRRHLELCLHWRIAVQGSVYGWVTVAGEKAGGHQLGLVGDRVWVRHSV